MTKITREEQMAPHVRRARAMAEIKERVQSEAMAALTRRQMHPSDAEALAWLRRLQELEKQAVEASRIATEEMIAQRLPGEVWGADGDLARMEATT